MRVRGCRRCRRSQWRRRGEVGGWRADLGRQSLQSASWHCRGVAGRRSARLSILDRHWPASAQRKHLSDRPLACAQLPLHPSAISPLRPPSQHIRGQERCRNAGRSAVLRHRLSVQPSSVNPVGCTAHRCLAARIFCALTGLSGRHGRPNGSCPERTRPVPRRSGGGRRDGNDLSDTGNILNRAYLVVYHHDRHNQCCLFDPSASASRSMNPFLSTGI